MAKSCAKSRKSKEKAEKLKKKEELRNAQLLKKEEEFKKKTEEELKETKTKLNRLRIIINFKWSVSRLHLCNCGREQQSTSTASCACHIQYIIKLLSEKWNIPNAFEQTIALIPALLLIKDESMDCIIEFAEVLHKRDISGSSFDFPELEKEVLDIWSRRDKNLLIPPLTDDFKRELTTDCKELQEARDTVDKLANQIQEKLRASGKKEEEEEKTDPENLTNAQLDAIIEKNVLDCLDKEQARLRVRISDGEHKDFEHKEHKDFEGLFRALIILPFRMRREPKEKGVDALMDMVKSIWQITFDQGFYEIQSPEEANGTLFVSMLKRIEQSGLSNESLLTLLPEPSFLKKSASDTCKNVLEDKVRAIRLAISGVPSLQSKAPRVEYPLLPN